MAKDLVCGKEVSEQRIDAAVRTVRGGSPETDPEAGTKRFHNGTWFYFCSIDCRQKFEIKPERYLPAT